MTGENKILRENIEHFRHLLTEGVSESDIKKYINNHEYVYMYYDGDDKTQSGNRTIRPYVLGTSKKSGKPVLRAWQDRGKSWHFQNKPTRDDSKYHDYWVDEDGEKPGWRMFRVDKISKMYPTGKKFHDENGLVMIPAGYHEGSDDDMSSVEAYVSTKTEPLDMKYDREVEPQQIPRPDQLKAKWNAIKRGNTNRRQMTADDVVKLRDIASRVYKKKHGSFLVAVDDRNNLHLITPQQKQKEGIPDTAIYGSLPYLYDTLVNANKTPDDRFFKSKLSQAQQQMNEENPSIPHKKMTFFK